MRRIVIFSLLATITALLAALACFEQRIPAFLLRRAENAISSGSVLVRADAAFFRFPRRLRLLGVRVFDKSEPGAVPVLSAESVNARISPAALFGDMAGILKSATVEGLRYPRLPNGYYVPDSVEFPGRPDFLEKNEPLDIVLPKFDPFRLSLVRPDILGIKAETVEAESVRFDPDRLEVADISLKWPDADAPMSLFGGVCMDLSAQRLSGSVRGQARQPNIRPLLAALDLPKAFPFFDAFTGVTAPVDAGCRFDVNLRNNDLHLNLDIHPTGGAYEGVPLLTAGGQLDIRVFVRDTFQNARIVVGPIAARLETGEMRGTVVYENTNDVGYVSFDVDSTTTLSNALAVADVMNDGTLDCLQTATPPHITLHGRLAVDPAYAATNDISGTLAFAEGSLFGIPLRRASSSFAVKGTDVSFPHARARSARGGGISGSGKISIPEFKREQATFNVDVAAENVPLADLADVFGIDAGERSGMISGSLSLKGPLDADLAARVSGEGRVSCRDGRLAQMKLFAGLTEYLSKNVPGVAALVNQSSGETRFKIGGGSVDVEEMLIEGTVFSIRGLGRYDMVEDSLDFTVRVQLFRKDSILSTLMTPVTWTFSKLLMEFKVSGPLASPEWKYVSVLEKLL